MSTALTTTGPTGLTPQSVNEAEAMAKRLSESTLVPEHFRGKPSDVFMAIAYGMEIGLPPVTALQAIAVIKGKPTLYAASMVALVLASGKAKYFRCVESDGTHAIYETHRHGDPEPRRKTFDYEDAKAAGLLGGNYSKYPRQMMEARAKAYLVRDAYPDVLHGMMSAEEVEEETEFVAGVDVTAFEEPKAEQVADVVEAEEVSVIDQVLGARSIHELEGLIPQLRELQGADREKALEIYKTHKAGLEKAAA